MSNFVAINHISKSFDPKLPPALDNITASLPKGEIIGLVGADGAGKTTLIRLIAALLLPTKGTIEINHLQGEAIHTIIGYMPQKFGLYEELTVAQNLNLYADLQNVVGEEKEKTFAKLLQFTSLTSFQDRIARALSGGMKQKLGLACALIKKPLLLLLDEPSVGVDPISRRELWKMVYELLDEGISVIWSTAYLDEAEKCHTVLLLNEGKLLFNGQPALLTKKVEGRSFLLSTEGQNRRALLSQLVQDEHVIDGVIQGKEIRLVLKEGATPPPFAKNTTERFEDAFVAILGGTPKGPSRLANYMPPVPGEEKEVIEAKEVTKRFGSFTAVDQISFSVKKGELFGLLGPNGAGKSTTFKMLCGLLTPTQGSATINGLDLQKASSAARSQIGYMAQKFSLYPNLTVEQNLHFFSGIYNMQGKKREEAITMMVDIFDLQKYLSIQTDSLPLGYKQRLSLACATMHHPPILFLDEPTSGVDPLTRREFWNHINGLVEKGVTVLVTTHFMDEAEYCDRVALIYQGKIITMGAPEELKNQCRSEALPNPTLEDAFISLIESYEAT